MKQSEVARPDKPDRILLLGKEVRNEKMGTQDVLDAEYIITREWLVRPKLSVPFAVFLSNSRMQVVHLF